MAYEAHEWVCGETITAEKLNNLEGGVEQASECCGAFIVNEDENTALDKTWQEIYDAFMSGKLVAVRTTGVNDSTAYVPISYISDDYYVEFNNAGSYQADSANGYPAQ